MTFEETPVIAPTNTIGEALLSLWRDPGIFIRHWNYKGAILSGGLRAPIFLITYLVSKESLKLALGAAFVQFTFRFLFAGIGGAMIQAFRRVEPAWKALITILMIVPVISHVFEYFVQVGFSYFTDTQSHTDVAIVRSVCVSIFSALFSLFIMRRNVMIVGEAGSESLFRDIINMPKMVFDFLAFIPHEIAAMFKRREFILAFFSILGFGVFSQLVCWACKFNATPHYWTYNHGKEIQILKYWGIDGIILMIFSVVLSLLLRQRPDKQP